MCGSKNKTQRALELNPGDKSSVFHNEVSSRFCRPVFPAVDLHEAALGEHLPRLVSAVVRGRTGVEEVRILLRILADGGGPGSEDRGFSDVTHCDALLLHVAVDVGFTGLETAANVETVCGFAGRS